MVMSRCASGILVSLTLIVFREYAAKSEVWKPPVESPITRLVTQPLSSWTGSQRTARACSRHISRIASSSRSKGGFKPESGGKELEQQSRVACASHAR